MQIDSNDGTQTVANNDPSTSNTSQPVATAPTATPVQSVQAPPSQQSPQQTSQQPVQNSLQQQPATNTVSNQPPVDPNANHPSVQRAGVLRSVATMLAGGPRYQTVIDPATGATTRTQVPLSRGQLGMAIALEALSGGIAGLGQRGPGALGQAAQAGFQQVSQQKQQAAQAQEQQAQQDYENQYQSTVRKAQIFSQNQQSAVQAQQAERLGLDNMQSVVDANAPLIAAYDEQGAIGDQHLTQAEIAQQLKAQGLSVTSHTALPDGITNLNGKPELTFSIVKSPETKLTLDQQSVDELIAGHVRGFPPGMTVPAGGYPIKGYQQIGRAHV